MRVSRYDAVAFVPEDLVKVAFWELYAAGAPLFVPDLALTSKVRESQLLRVGRILPLSQLRGAEIGPQT